MPLSPHRPSARPQWVLALGLTLLLPLAFSGCAKTECESQEDCTADEYCDRKSFYGTDVCEERGDRGDSCNPLVFGTPGSDRAIEQGSCKEGLLCFELDDLNGVCRPPQGVGGPCSSFEYCKDGLTCDRGSDGLGEGRCRARSAEGGACTLEVDCLDGLFCADGDSEGTCAPKRREGETCTGYDACEGELVCAAGICSEAEGLSCERNGDCFHGLSCIDGSCGRP